MMMILISLLKKSNEYFFVLQINETNKIFLIKSDSSNADKKNVFHYRSEFVSVPILIPEFISSYLTAVVSMIPF